LKPKIVGLAICTLDRDGSR